MNLGQLLEAKTKEHPKRAALIHEGKSVTFDEFNKNVNRLANGLKGLGIKGGDRVAIMLPNTPEFVYAFFACQKLGAIAVPFNTMYKGGEIFHILNDCGAKAIITLNSMVPLINEIKPELPQLRHIITTGERTLTFADPESTLFLQGVLAKDTFKDLDEAYQRIGDALVEGFSKTGLDDVWYKQRGSLRVGGKKLAGFSFSEIENLYILNVLCFLTPFDPTDFFHVIWVPPEVKDKVIEPLTSIQEATGKRPTDDAIQKTIIEALEKGLGVTLQEGALSRDEIFGYEKYKATAKKK
ncbi:MAG: AMP-binding protein [Deltaproteobacteria bacterium]|nr:AMP-binding protein [Deltaproteobacteria bacterium]